jgi:FMN phosphatase YigB (HAD superfamily)
LKIDTHGLRKYFDHIEICDVNRHKNSEDWKRTFYKLDVNPEYGTIIGDNIKGDIIAGHSIGVRKLFWINKAGAWTPYSTGDIPEETVTVGDLKEVIPILKQKENN